MFVSGASITVLLAAGLTIPGSMFVAGASTAVLFAAGSTIPGEPVGESPSAGSDGVITGDELLWGSTGELLSTVALLPIPLVAVAVLEVPLPETEFDKHLHGPLPHDSSVFVVVTGTTSSKHSQMPSP